MIKATDFIIRRFYYRTSNVKLRPKKPKDSRPKGQLRKTGKIWIILLVRLKACGFGTVCLVALLRNASRSNLRSLADKRACRLGFARLSAPSLAVRARRKRDKSLPLRQKSSEEIPRIFYPSRRLGISSALLGWISSRLWRVYYHAPACILCDLMRYNTAC